MNYLHAIVLGIVQGLTEFLPISSSAHLVLLPHLLGWQFPKEQIFPFGVLVQLGTLVAVIIYFWKDLWGILTAFVQGILRGKPFADPQAQLGWHLILATIPAAVIGLLLKDRVEAAFQSPTATAGFLFITAALLIIAERLSRRTRPLQSLNWKDALWIGFFQAASIFPGISRSGSTITGAMLRQFERPAAARFSFLMSVPVMLAAGLVSLLDLRDVPNLASFLPVVAVGFLAALVVGYLSIRWLLAYLTRHSLLIFAVYCAVFGAIILILGYAAAG